MLKGYASKIFANVLGVCIVHDITLTKKTQQLT